MNLIDPDGRVVVLVGNQEQKQAALEVIRHSLHNPEAAAALRLETNHLVFDFKGNESPSNAIRDAINSDKMISYGLGKNAKTEQGGDAYTDPTGEGNSSISIDPQAFPPNKDNYAGGVYQDLDTATQHEFGHALGIAAATWKDRSILDQTNPDALSRENKAREFYRNTPYGKSERNAYQKREKHD